MTVKQHSSRNQDSTVSAVIPAYNAAETIERALDSVYAQTYDNIIEVIVVDDGSEDNTAAIVREKYPDVALIQQENKGVSRARNTGVDRARGECVAFLDADDEWLPQKTELQVDMMGRHHGLALTTCAAHVVGPASSTSRATEPPGEPGLGRRLTFIRFRDYIRRMLPPSVHFCCSGWLFKRDLFVLHGGLDEDLYAGEDWDFLLRLTGQGYTVGAVLEPLYRYHVLSDSLCHSAEGRRALCEIGIEIIRRYDPAGEGWQSELLTPSEFRSLLQQAYASRAWSLFELGEREGAREYLQKAAELSDARGLRALRERFAAWNPGLYHALSRLRDGADTNERGC